MFNHTGLISDLFPAVSFSLRDGPCRKCSGGCARCEKTGLPDAVSEIFCFLGHLSVARLSSRSRERGRLIPQNGFSKWQCS